MDILVDKTIRMNIAPLGTMDFVLVGMIVFFAALGFLHGLVKLSIEVAAFLIGLLVTAKFYPVTLHLLQSGWFDPTFSAMASAFITFILVFSILVALIILLDKYAGLIPKGMVSRVLGLIVGAILGIALVVVIAMEIPKTLGPLKSKKVFTNSKILSKIREVKGGGLTVESFLRARSHGEKQSPRSPGGERMKNSLTQEGSDKNAPSSHP